jgi:succinate-semialdehyde dehydrogenase/glutarate-semialdehyde dehydrogenase/aspartate-semialdehyde dehydrogenase
VTRNLRQIVVPQLRGLSASALERLRRPDLLETRAFIAGAWIASDLVLPVRDPANGELLAEVAACPVEWVDRAILAARNSMPAWQHLTPQERGTVLRAWSAGIQSNMDDLTVIITAEQGKPLAEARCEIAYAASFLDWFAAEGERMYGETIPSHLSGSRLAVQLQPIGISAAITPWNFPSAMITRKAGAALAAGCVMIVKPAPETPLSALALAKLGHEAGIPSGVFQVITGEAAPLASRLLEHTEVRALSFTGSTEVGRLLLAQAARTVKKVSLELGGHAPFLVFGDSPVSFAVAGCMSAKFATSGQDCLAANRIYVHRSIYERFACEFAAATAKLKVGHGLVPNIDIGPMTKTSVADKCRAHVDDALRHGARRLTGGEETSLGSNFIMPTVLADVTDDMLIAHEETFGPVAALLPFDSESEVTARANATESGLAAYLYTEDLRRAMRVTDRLEYGMVAVNTPQFTGPPIPFGGWKQSGLGREGSRHGILEYLQPKYVCIGNAYQ